MNITEVPFYHAGHKEKQQLDQTQAKIRTGSLGYESKPNYVSQSQGQSPSQSQISFNRRFNNEGKSQTPSKCIYTVL